MLTQAQKNQAIRNFQSMFRIASIGAKKFLQIQRLAHLRSKELERIEENAKATLSLHYLPQTLLSISPPFP